MVDRSAWWRTGAGIAAWLVLAVATAGVAWAAVGVVSEQGDDAAPVAVPAATRATGSTPASTRTPRTTRPPRTSGTEPTPSSTSSPSSDPTEPETDDPPQALSSRALSSRGGSVSVECTGSRTIRLVFATSADGWQQSVEESGPEEVEVEFVRGDEELRTRARCDGGAVEGEAESD